MLQLVYISSATVRGDQGLDQILAASRRNNARDRVTGLLFADGVRFLQALEGETAAVEAAFDRIRDDPRHRAVVVLSRREIATREFGPWDMAARTADADGDAFMAQVERLVAGASPAVRGTFAGLATVRRAAA